MKKIIAVLTALALIIPGAAFASPLTSEEKVTLIVEVRGDAVLEAQQAAEYGANLFSETEEAQKLEKSIKSRQMQVLSEIESKVDAAAEIGFVYSYVFNGFSIEAYESDIEKIKALPNVENVYVSKEYELYESDAAEDKMSLDSGCEMMNIGYMHDAGINGEGTVIAVIDNGFDVNHDNFQGQITAPRLSKSDIDNIIKNESLSINAMGGNVTANRVYINEKIPYAYNYYNKISDTYNASNSHGTHVAGIAAGNNGTDPLGGKFTGTAPQAQLLLMACPVLTTVAVVAAIDDAVKLGADVINASFGADYEEEDEPEERAIIAAVNAGVLFSAAAGNSARGYAMRPVNAENIDYSAAGTPNGFSGSTAVASADNTSVWSKYYTMSVDSEQIKFSDENGSASFAQTFCGGPYEYIYVGTGTQAEFKNAEANGKIVLIDRGSGISFAERITNAKAAGATGAVFINSEEALNINIAPVSLQKMPTAAVMPSDGEKMKNASNKTLSASTNIVSGILSSGSTKISSFSSWGTDSSLKLKPEITAPGGNIYSSVNDNKYQNMSGTSMAAPHMTGAVALLKQYIRANPQIYGNPSGVQMTELAETLLMTSADVLMEDTESQIPYSPRSQGAGMVNLEKAVNTPVTLIGDQCSNDGNVHYKSKISLGEIESNELNITFKARNLKDTDAVYDKINMTVITDSADSSGIIGGMRKLTFSADLPSSVTVPARSETEVSARVTLDQAELDENMESFKNGFFIDGFVFLGTSDEALPEISIPFMGFYGGWDSAPALDKPMFEKDSVLGLTFMSAAAKRAEDGSSSSNYSRKKLGVNQFVSEKSSEYEEYCSEEFAGISPNGDGEFDTPVGIVTPLRQLGKTNFYIYDSKGAEIAKAIDIASAAGGYFCAPKFRQSYLSFDYKKIISSMKEGDYTFKIEAGFKGQKEYDQNESVEMKFYVDRTNPVITKFETYSEGDKTYLDVAAEDNRHLMGIVVSGTKNGGIYRKVHPIKGTQTAECTFDITGVDSESLSVESVDYALNSELRSAVGLSIESAGVLGSSFSFYMNNTSGDSISAYVTVALYRGGVLAGVSSRNITIAKDLSMESFSIPNGGYDTVKVFVWDAPNSIKPLYGVFEF